MRTREEPVDPTEIINSESAEPLSEQKQILTKLDHFKQLLNTQSDMTAIQETDTDATEALEPDKLSEEIIEAVRSAPLKKKTSPGQDEIPK